MSAHRTPLLQKEKQNKSRIQIYFQTPDWSFIQRFQRDKGVGKKMNWILEGF